MFPFSSDKTMLNGVNIMADSGVEILELEGSGVEILEILEEPVDKQDEYEDKDWDKYLLESMGDEGLLNDLFMEALSQGGASLLCENEGVLSNEKADSHPGQHQPSPSTSTSATQKNCSQNPRPSGSSGNGSTSKDEFVFLRPKPVPKPKPKKAKIVQCLKTRKTTEQDQDRCRNPETA